MDYLYGDLLSLPTFRRENHMNREVAIMWLRRYHHPYCQLFAYVEMADVKPGCDCNGDPLGLSAVSPIDHMPKTLDAEGRSLDATYSY